MADETQVKSFMFTGIYPVDLGDGIGVCFRDGGRGFIYPDGTVYRPQPPQCRYDEVRARYADKKPSPYQIAEYKRVRAVLQQIDDVTHKPDPPP